IGPPKCTFSSPAKKPIFYWNPFNKPCLQWSDVAGQIPGFFVFPFAFSRTCNNTCKYACNCTCIYTCEMYSYENKEKLLTPYILITEPLFTCLKLALISRLNFLTQPHSAPTLPRHTRQPA